MNVSLTPKLEQIVKQLVESGMYSNSSEVIREALRVFLQKKEQAALHSAIQQGIDDILAGRTTKSTVSDIARRVKAKH